MLDNPNIEKMKICKHSLWFDEMTHNDKKVYRKLRKAKEKDMTRKIIKNERSILSYVR